MNMASLIVFFGVLTHGYAFHIPRHHTKNVFLNGPFKPVSSERSLVCEIEGRIPRVVEDHMFSRIGPNPRFDPIGGYHLFDGDGITHWVRFDRNMDGSLSAMYHNRYIRTCKLKAEEKAGRPIFFNVGDFAKPFALLKIMYSEMLKAFSIIPSLPRSHMSVANTNIVQHSDKTLAMCESGLPYSVDISESGLDTIGVESFDGFLKDSFTAHPKINPKDGKMYGFGSDGSDIIRMYVFGKDGSPERSFPIEMHDAVLMHDFAITSDHMLLLEMPLEYDMKLLFKGRIPVEFKPDHSSRIGVLDKDDTTGSSIKWFDVPGDSFMVSHVVNAHHEAGIITLTTCDMDSISLNEVCSSISVLHRIKIDLKSGSVSRDPILEKRENSFDFPVINRSMTGIKNRYSYVTEFNSGIPGGIFKIDLEKNAIDGSIEFEHGENTGECSFIPSGDGEDDGYLLSFVSNQDENESSMRIWDARDMSQVGSVKIPARIPLGFHSNSLHK